ncbi:MAG TPA: hypothetical protein VGM30_09095 [Puia sp.]
MLNPQDPIVNYDPTAPPVQPAFGKIGKWVRTPYVDWNSDAYKCYIYKGTDFRLHFPQTYKPGDGKKYPILVFYHGNGEEGPIYQNELQLKNGGLLFHQAEVAGVFDGYIIFMQTTFGWGTTELTNLKELIDTLVQGYGGDPYRVIQNGLSGGGQGVWQQIVANPTYFAGAIPMSAALGQDATPADIKTLRFTPMWNLDGGQDDDPPPYTAQVIASAFLSAGANYVYKNYPTLGHDTWDSTWLEPDFWPFVNRAYLSNPWPLSGKTVFCTGQSLKVTLGIVPGLAGYQWRMNGAVIPKATADTLVVTKAGTYDARVLRGSTWSDWSHIPVQIFGQTPAPATTIVQTNCATATGIITITSPKGVGLTYSIDGVHYQTDSVFAGVAAGTYHLTVKNGTTCTSSATTAIINPRPPPAAGPTLTVTQPTCTVSTGTIIATPANNALSYSINDTVYQSSPDFSGLATGNYFVTTKTPDGCISDSSPAVIYAVPSAPAKPAVATVQPTCTVSTGSIDITVPAGTGFLYSIDSATFQGSSSFSGLAANNYTVVIKNSAGCISPPVAAVIHTQPTTPSTPAINVVQPTCAVPAGSINIISPSAAGVAYSVDGAAYQSGSHFTNLVPGNYLVTAKDSGGCVSPSTPAIIQPLLIVPSAPAFDIRQPNCSSATGSILITSPTNAGFLYSSDGETYLPDTGMTNLAPGTYQITVKDDSGCVSAPTTAIVLTEPVYCNVIIGAYPNPYQSEVSFNITSPYTGKGLLAFYNLLGEQMGSNIETNFVAGIPTTITCPMGFAHRQPVIYLFSIGKKKVQGTLLPEKF